MVWKSWKTKVKFLYEIPLSVALFGMTQPVDSASLSWIIAFLRTGSQLWGHRGIKMRVEGSWSPCECGFNLPVGSFPILPKGRADLPEGRAPNPYHLHPCLLRPLLCAMASPLSAAHLPWMGWGREDPVERKCCGCYEGPPSPGEGEARDL